MFSRLTPLFSAAILGPALLCILSPARAASVLVEAEDFQFPGNWTREGSMDALHGYYLKAANSGQTALTQITITEAGTYHVWTRTRGYAEHAGKRRYQLLVDQQAAENESGAAPDDGWAWERVDTRRLAAGTHVLELRDTARFFGRCDAVFLTTGDRPPADFDIAALSRFRMTPDVIEPPATELFAALPTVAKTSSATTIAQLENASLRVTFTEHRDTDGLALISRAIELKQNGRWVPLPLRSGEETLFLLSSPKSKVNTGYYFPSWENGLDQPLQLGGRAYRIANFNNPFHAGDAATLVPRVCLRPSADVVDIEYKSASGASVATRWRLDPDAPVLAVTASFEAPADGEYSVGFKAFQSWERDGFDFDLLPPLYQYQRLPSSPGLLLSTQTPQPLALIQSRFPGVDGAVSLAVAADVHRLPREWPRGTPSNAPYGFSLLNERGRAQPVLFTPVLGLPDSRLRKGETKTVSWNLLVQAGDWQTALATASDKIFGVRDYRRSAGTSLTAAAFNMIDLIKDAEASGWDARLKGFYNLESSKTGSQASPLTLLSVALLTRDEEFYRTRALPTIESILTRPKPHFANDPKAGHVDYVPPEARDITIPSRFYGTSYWQGLHQLLGAKNAWIATLALDEGQVRHSSSYSTVPRWSELLAAYRLEPTPERLAAAEAACAAYLTKEVYGRHERDIGTVPFYNVAYYPYWWDFLDLYELTGKKTYLEAAEFGASLTIAGLASWPRVIAGDTAINLPTTFSGKERVWWRGAEHYRLGWPMKAGDLPEKTAPDWIVSRVGLGLEQPSTYFAGGDGTGLRNITMSSWGANLLRLYGHTGNALFQTYARNTVIGRFANYPGYYIHGYTDVPNHPRFPYEGPDVTDIYYHHIPAHLALTLDYLVTEAWSRSKGAISFPWAKQQGYVWFSNRVYGDAPGKVYGRDGQSLWLDRQAAVVGSDQLNYLTVRGPENWSIILMNESDDPVASTVAIDTQKTGALLAGRHQLIVDGKTTERTGGFDGRVTVSPKGITVLVFPAKPADPVPTASAPALPYAPVVLDLGGAWGRLHAFRIRSPFGTDSLYAVLTGRPPEGSSAELVDEKGEVIAPAVADYPFEFTVYPWAQDKDCVFRVRLSDDKGAVTLSEAVRLEGTPIPASR
ncbi:MAG: hypothetical protein H7067_01310 [Burkholderiales bacterium]|nr:hypothetical protein [Opitutaceae bacterium]